jgi:hypothetical protein
MAFSKKPTPGAKPAKKKSRYAGVKAAAPRDPMPHVGEYRFRVLECEEGYNQGTDRHSFKAKCEIVMVDDVGEKSHAAGDVVQFMQLISGKSATAGLPRVKAFVMASAGYEDEDEFDAFDPDGEFIDATTGTANGYSEAELTIVGRLVDCKVTRGNALADGTDYYREYAWSVVPEEEQDAVGKVEAP